MEKRREEIEAKRAKLAELKRQRELRREAASSRASNGSPDPEIRQPTPRKDLDEYIDRLIGQRSTTPRSPAQSPAQRAARPISSISMLSSDNEGSTRGTQTATTMADRETQTLSMAPLMTVVEYDGEPRNEKEVVMYSKGVQTTDDWPADRHSRGVGDSGSEREDSPTRTSRAGKRLSRRQKEKEEEERREQIRKEIEEELRREQGRLEEEKKDGKLNFPFRTATDEELEAMENNEDFADFVEKTTKVLEKMLDLDIDVLKDYGHTGADVDSEDEGYGSSGGRKGRKVKEVAQFWDERWSKKRMISDLDFCSQFPELVLASYTKNPSAPHDPDGLVQIWNPIMKDRPEYKFTAQSDILTAKFSPFHPHIVIGGAYSGQVLLWDMRAKSAPVQKTPLTGSGHTHPVYSLDIVGTQNANNIISCSTDGVVCGWSLDMLSNPQEYLELTSPPPSKTDDMAPTCIAFPQSDPTYFLAGTEEGSIYPCHRYDRAGAKAGVDSRVKYGGEHGHQAPVMSLDFHPTKGQIDLGDLVLSSSVDWSVKLWKVRPPAATGASAISTLSSTNASQQVEIKPILDIAREDLVYDARWSPVKPAVFALVDGAGSLEIWDLNVDTEVPVQKVFPSEGKSEALAGLPKLPGGGSSYRSLNRVAWEKNEGRRVAVGGMDGVVTVFEVGQDLGGAEVRGEEWSGVKRLVSRLEGGGEGAK